MSDTDIVFFDPEGAQSYPNIAAVEGYLGGVGTLMFPGHLLPPIIT